MLDGVNRLADSVQVSRQYITNKYYGEPRNGNMYTKTGISKPRLEYVRQDWSVYAKTGICTPILGSWTGIMDWDHGLESWTGFIDGIKGIKLDGSKLDGSKQAG